MKEYLIKFNIGELKFIFSYLSRLDGKHHLITLSKVQDILKLNDELNIISLTDFDIKVICLFCDFYNTKYSQSIYEKTKFIFKL